MKYLKRYNESSKEDWNLEEIGDIFQDVIDCGFSIEDVSIGSSISIAPKSWCNSANDLGNKHFKSLTIKFESTYKVDYDLSFLDVLDECIKHFESYYDFKLDSIYTVGLPTVNYSSSGAKIKKTIFNWFNSCETIRYINKVSNEIQQKIPAEKLIDKFPLTGFDLTFDLSK